MCEGFMLGTGPVSGLSQWPPFGCTSDVKVQADVDPVGV